MRTLLFDIDGTLLTTAGGGNRAFAKAMEIEFGVSDPDTSISFSGRTDRSLLLELLERNEVEATVEHCGRLRRSYLKYFETELTACGGTLLPGAEPLLRSLAGRDNLVVGVLTGNFPESATRKLEHFALRRWVEWIIGGDLDVDRNDMARRAQRFICGRYGSVARQDMIVIGDTPADIECGHAIGARVLAVATGTHSVEELQSKKPWHLATDLSDTEAIVALLTS
ncbi:MAG: HAD family hydrolase [Planctomycetota bacterium]